MEERIHELEEKQTNKQKTRNAQSEPERENKLERNKQNNFGDLWHYKKISNIHFIGVLEGGRRKRVVLKKILKEIMAEKSPLFDKRHKPKESRSQVNIKQDKF